MNVQLAKFMSAIVFSILLTGCVGFLYGPGGVSCKAVDVNIGGGTEAAGNAEAWRKNCLNDPRRERAQSCCYKMAIFISRSCPLVYDLRVGQSCYCQFPNGMVAGGTVCHVEEE